MTSHPASNAKGIEALIFDLDDTIVDTFASLIEPLEREAADEMVAAGMRDADANEVVELILRLRQEEPDSIEERLVEKYPEAEGRALEARRKVFAHASPDKLRIEPAVKEMLRELSKRYDTYLLTTGRTDFQNRKLDNLEIRGLFKEVEVLASGSEETKERWLASLIERGYDAQAVVVVGNRLDNEIKAGHRLGMITVWMKYGEGSGLIPCEETGHPDYVIRDISEFPGVLARIESSRAHS
jgi:FMN phosphatase YigB (HAD superfamily)